MASNTENLDLLMKNPSTDGADTFNVQTMLNENWQKIDNNAGTVAQTLANILKPTTPPIIGLLPFATPDGMFQALAKTGDLHVWRKTVKNAADVPAGYTLGDVQTGNFKFVANSYRTFEFGTPSVDDAGNVGLNVEGSVNGRYNSNFDNLKGKFCRPPDSTWYIDASLGSQVIYIPADATFSQSGSYKYVDKYQLVTGYPLTPAGTTTTYPVSTNRNAYQEGDDAKPAGYTLGEVKTGTFAMATGNVQYSYASSVSVSDDGTVSLVSPSSTTLSADASSRTIALSMRGKYVKATSSLSNCGVPFSSGSVVFLPADAVVSGTVDIDRYQPVTGYAAIPANTTIEYLGCLGDKARVQVVSYVGTGTYGSSNPNSLTFDFVPKAVFVVGTQYSDGDGIAIMPMIYGYGFSNRSLNDVNANYCIVTWNKKNVTWYAFSSNAVSQSNSQGGKYFAVAIG